MTNMKELAPAKSEVPSVLFIKSIIVKYGEEYIFVELIDSSI